MRTTLVLSLLLILTFPFGIPTVAEETRSNEVDPERLDPVIASVVRMLKQKVPPETISTWLDQIDTPPATPSADGLIALTQAGAPDDLIQKILEIAAAAKTPTPGSPEREPTQATDAEYPVRFQVSYSPQVIEYQETPWDLFVYVDGRPLVRADGWAAHSKNHRDWQTIEVALSPGRHVIRLLQEQHQLKSKRKGTWSHAAYLMGDPIELDLEPEGVWQVRIEAREGSSAFAAGKVAFEITRDGETVDHGSQSGISGKGASPLCEEAEETLSPKELNSKTGQAATRNCVRWASLWGGVDSVPERRAVREEMQTNNFNLGPN